MVTRCRFCDKPLAIKPTAWTCGPMFCSHTCGVNWAKAKYDESEYTDRHDLYIKAKAYFDDIAEEIGREDYGARVERFTTYDTQYDISVIFEQIFEGDELISQSVIGWYYGEPNEEDDNNNGLGLTALSVD